MVSARIRRTQSFPRTGGVLNVVARIKLTNIARQESLSADAAHILNNNLHFATAADHESATDAVIMSVEFVSNFKCRCS